MKNGPIFNDGLAC